MKNTVFFTACCLVLFAALAAGAGPITIPATSFTTATGNIATLQGQMVTLTGSVATLQGQMVTLTGSVATLQGQIVSQNDTNATTTETLYVPRMRGDVLTGGAGAGTNAIWISKGTTTNDWILIEP